MASDVPVLRFESYELDVRSRELRRGAERVRLQEQPFEILRLMLERPGDVVTREELVKRLWPDGTFVDYEHSLNAAVKRLRTALGDDADNPRFVETLPRRGYRFIARLGGTEGPGDGAALERARLAVLPFSNLTGDATQEWFSDGLTDEMIAQLGRLGRGRVAVIARWSSMVFKGSTRRAREIGETLRADYLLEGSVRRDGDRVRISAWLVEAAGETHLWSDTYDRRLTDCLAVQADVAARIARSLAMELTGDEPAVQHAGAADSAAYEIYLKGRYHWNLPANEGVDQALEYYGQALQIDPAFAAAWAGLARAWIARSDYYMAPSCTACEEAERAARRALELDPGLSDAHLALGDVRRVRDHDWQGAETSYAQAIALNPSSEAAHRAYAGLLAGLGRLKEADREARRARTLDPLCLVVGVNSAWVSYLKGDYHSAIEQCGVVMEMDPRFLRGRRVLGAALLQSGHPVEATVELKRALALAPNDRVTRAWLAHATAAAGDHRAASSLRAGIEAQPGTGVTPSYHLAFAHLAVGHHDAALDALERAAEECDPALVALAVEPRFAPLREEARFKALRKRLNLEA